MFPFLVSLLPQPTRRDLPRTRAGQIGGAVMFVVMMAVIYYQNRFTEAPLGLTEATQQDSQQQQADHATQQLMVEVTPAQRASMQSHVSTVPLQVWQTRSYCSGARPRPEHVAALAHGTAAKGKRLFVKSGDKHVEQAAILMQLEPADAQGIVHVPHLDAQHGLLTAENGAAEGRLAALPSGAASHVYCVVDLDAQAVERAIVDDNKRALQSGEAPHLRVDFECMQRKWQRCDFVLRLEAPTELTRQQARRPFVGGAAKRAQHALDDDDTLSVVGVIVQALPCPGRGGECTQWTGPMPK